MHSKPIPRAGVASTNPNPIVPRKCAPVIQAPVRARRRRQPGGTPPQMNQKTFHLADHVAEVARAGALASRPFAVLPGIAVAGPRPGAHGPAMHAATLSAMDGGPGRAYPAGSAPRSGASGASTRYHGDGASTRDGSAEVGPGVRLGLVQSGALASVHGQDVVLAQVRRWIEQEPISQIRQNV
jgi:hypothetical protein